jgi:hypothetical protein
MSPTIPVTPPCAAQCRRLEIVASRRVAAVWILWSVSVCVVVCAATALPWLARAAICLTIMVFNADVVRRCVLLIGSQAARVLEWRAPDDITVLLGAARELHPASLAAGSFRLGGLLVLRLRTPGGMRVVLIDGERQEIRAFRCLCRTLNLSSRATKRPVPGARGSRADTIRPKV